MKARKKSFCIYTASKRKTKEGVGPLLSEAVDLVTTNTEKAEVLSAIFASIFTSKSRLQDKNTCLYMDQSFLEPFIVEIFSSITCHLLHANT